MQDLLRVGETNETSYGYAAVVLILLGTLRIHHYVASEAAKFFHLMFILQIYLMNSYRLPRQFHPKGTLLYGHKVLIQMPLWLHRELHTQRFLL